MDIHALYRLFLKHPKISTDSRNILENSIFFALKGESFDGNFFAEEALNKGAAYAVVDDPKWAGHDQIFLTKDVLNTLQELALHHRNQLQIPFLAITGSNGKTTTKELVQAILSEGFRVYATRGNLNNHIGVPLTLLEIPEGTELAIIEMGANHLHEIEALCKIARPTHGLITNIGKAHLEGFGGFEGVKKAKGELYDYLKEHRGHIFVQKNNPILKEMLGDYQNITSYSPKQNLSLEMTADIEGMVLTSNPYLTLNWTTGNSASSSIQEIKTHLAGSYNLENVLAAIAVGHFFGLNEQQINRGVSGYVPTNHRSQIVISTRGNQLICDYYNANASSMAAALENFGSIKATEKILILGDMFELGDSSDAEHQKVIDQALSSDATSIFLIGKHFFAQQHKYDTPKLRIQFFESLTDATAFLQNQPLANSWILVKGSRGMTLEKLIPLL